MSEETKKDAENADLGERLTQALTEPYITVVKYFQNHGLRFTGVELDGNEVILKFSSNYNDISFVMYKLLVDEFNYIKVRSSLCDYGGTPLACLELTVAMPRQT